MGGCRMCLPDFSRIGRMFVCASLGQLANLSRLAGLRVVFGDSYEIGNEQILHGVDSGMVSSQ